MIKNFIKNVIATFKVLKSTDGSDILEVSDTGMALTGDASVTGKLGVGTDTPLNKASIAGRVSVLAATESSPASGKTLQIYQNSAGGYGELFSYDFDGSAALPLVLQRPGGNVGIKNTSPAEALDVTGNIKASGNIYGNIIGNVNASGTVLSNNVYSCKKNTDGNLKSWELFTLETPIFNTTPVNTTPVNFESELIIAVAHMAASGVVATEYCEYRIFMDLISTDATVEKRYSRPNTITPGFSSSYYITSSAGVITLVANTPVADDEIYLTVTRK